MQGTVVGRDAELAAIGEALDRVREAAPATVWIEAEAGVGKSTLLDRAAALADERDIALWRVTGDVAEQFIEHGITRQLLGIAGGDASGTGADPYANASLLQEHVEAAAASRPLVIIVDDLHWCDPSSRQTLRHLLRRLHGRAVLVVLAHRPMGDWPDEVRRAASHLHQVRLQLDGLSVGALRELMAARGIRLTPRAARRLHDHTGGNPQLLTALAEELGVGELTSGEGPLPAPKSFVEVVERRFDEATPEVRAVVGAVSISGVPVSLAHITAMTGIDRPEGAVDRAIEHGLLRIVARRDNRLVDVQHALVRSSINQGMPFTEYERLNARAAELVSDPLMRMFHRLHASASFDEALFDEAAELAEERASQGALLASARLLEAAGKVVPPGPQRSAAWTSAAERLLVLGELQWAERLMADVAAENGGEPTAHELLVTGHRALQQRRHDEAREAAFRAWTHGGDARVVVGASEILAYLGMDEGDGAAATLWAERALDAVEPPHVSVRWAATVLASGWAILGDLERAKELLEGYRARLAGTGSEQDIVLGLCLASLWTADWTGAQRFLSELQPFDRIPSVVTRSTVRLVRAVIGHRTGAWDEVVAMTESELGHIDDGWESRTASMTLAVGASVLGVRGETVRARNLIDRAESLLTDDGDLPSRIMLALARARTAAAGRDWPEAIRHLAPLPSMADRIPEGVHAWRAVLAEAYVAVGRLDDAEAVLDRADTSGDSYASAGMRLARASLLLARGDGAGAERMLTSIVEDGVEQVGVLHLARARAMLGAQLRRRGRRREAAALLAPALDVFERLGIPPFIQEASAELEACALRRGNSLLTPAEERVARLAVQGRTNREIAQALSVSIKTVETHMGRVFMKLGVRHRVELVGAFAEPPA